MRPSRGSRALEAIIRDLIGTRDGATYFAERVWGVSLHYDLGSGHPLVGRSVPDFELADGRKIGAFFGTGKGLLLDFNADAPLEVLSGSWGDRIAYIASAAKDRLGLSALVVRPDGVVAWVSKGVPNLEEAAQAASRWFGEPDRSVGLPKTDGGPGDRCSRRPSAKLAARLQGRAAPFRIIVAPMRNTRRFFRITLFRNCTERKAPLGFLGLLEIDRISQQTGASQKR